MSKGISLQSNKKSGREVGGLPNPYEVRHPKVAVDREGSRYEPC
jgi:hypothetical protein